MSTIYRLIVYQTFSIPNDILGKAVEVLNPFSSNVKHIVSKEFFDSHQKAIDRETYYGSTYPDAILTFDVVQVSVG